MLCRRAFIGLAAALATIAFVSAPSASAHQHYGYGARADVWIGSWSRAPQGPVEPFVAEPEPLENQTVRMIVRPSVSGDQARIWLSNSYGAAPLVIDAASIGSEGAKGAIKPKSLRQLTFGGDASITIPIGARAVSDPVDLKVKGGRDLVVNLYVESATSVTTLHSDSQTTNYVTPPGDFTKTKKLPQGSTEVLPWYWLTGVDVRVADDADPIVVVAIGDSITDGNTSTVDANKRWPDILAKRLNAKRSFGPAGVLNMGISGNRVLSDLLGDSALARLDRDVLAQTGVTHVILLEGVNDIGIPEFLPTEPAVSADEIIAGMKQIIARAHANGLKIFGGTLTPYRGALYFTEEGEEKRQAVNAFIRDSGAFDGVIDFDKAIRDPKDPSRMLPIYDSGDNLHPSDAGYVKMGKSVNLKLFARY